MNFMGVLAKSGEFYCTFIHKWGLCFFFIAPCRRMGRSSPRCFEPPCQGISVGQKITWNILGCVKIGDVLRMASEWGKNNDKSVGLRVLKLQTGNILELLEPVGARVKDIFHARCQAWSLWWVRQFAKAWIRDVIRTWGMASGHSELSWNGLYHHISSFL